MYDPCLTGGGSEGGGSPSSNGLGPGTTVGLRASVPQNPDPDLWYQK
jgi:hypothetical protein